MKLAEDERSPDEAAAGGQVPLGNRNGALVVLISGPAEGEQGPRINEGPHAFARIRRRRGIRRGVRQHPGAGRRPSR